MSGLAAITSSVAIIAMVVLLIGGIRLIRGGDRSKGMLMIVAGLVLLGNVLIWTWPATP